MKNNPREFWIVLSKKEDPFFDKEDAARAFIDPGYQDFKYWKEHEHIWEVVHVRETGLKPVEKEIK